MKVADRTGCASAWRKACSRSKSGRALSKDVLTRSSIAGVTKRALAVALAVPMAVPMARGLNMVWAAVEVLEVSGARRFASAPGHRTWTDAVLTYPLPPNEQDHERELTSDGGRHAGGSGSPRRQGCARVCELAVNQLRVFCNGSAPQRRRQ